MNLSAPFVRRPIATVLLTIGVALAGIAAFFALPVSPLPQVDYPTISVSASLPGASPDTMATSVATPLERRLGTIAGVNEMTSTSSTGSARISLQFALERNIDGAAREVQAAINASRVDLPATLRSNPTYRKANPSDAPIMILALTSKTKTPGQIYESVSNLVSQRLFFRRAAAQLIEQDVHYRRRQQRQHLAGDEATDDRDAERLAQLRALAETDRQRQRAQGCGQRRHQDRPEAQQASFAHRFQRRQTASALGFQRKVDDQDRILLDDADQQEHADQRDDGKVHAEEQQRDDGADAGRRQRR